MKRRLLLVALLLFGSGTTALIYQVAWMRELRLIFGFSTAASAAVVAIFMGGLGAGSWWLGRKADRGRPSAGLLWTARAGGGRFGGRHAPAGLCRPAGLHRAGGDAHPGSRRGNARAAPLLGGGALRADGPHGRDAAGGDAVRRDGGGPGAPVSRAPLRLQHARRRRGSGALDVPAAGDFRNAADSLAGLRRQRARRAGGRAALPEGAAGAGRGDWSPVRGSGFQGAGAGAAGKEEEAQAEGGAGRAFFRAGRRQPVSLARIRARFGRESWGSPSS